MSPATMPTTIWKFTDVPIEDSPRIPMVAKLVRWLHVELSDDYTTLTLWAEVKPFSERSEQRSTTPHIHVRGTGHPLTGYEGTHIGTVINHRWELVWHVFADDVEIEL